MSIAQRNRAIKRVLKAYYGKRIISVTGGTGTATGWVNLTIQDPEPVSNHAATKQMIVQTILDAGIDLGYYHDDHGNKRYELSIRRTP